MELLFLDNVQSSGHSEYIFYQSVPVISRLHTELVVTHAKEKLVGEHLLLHGLAR